MEFLDEDEGTGWVRRPAAFIYPHAICFAQLWVFPR